MPDINFGPPPSSGPLKPLLVSATVLALVAAAVFFFNPRTTAEVTITGTQLASPHTVMKPVPGGIHVIGSAPEADDDLYVAVRVRITDKLRLPLFIKEVTAILAAPDAPIADADVTLPADMPAIATTFPALKPLVQSPLPRDAEIAPGATTEGVVLLHFPHMTTANWTGRKQATLTFNFFHQSPITMTVP